MDIHSPLTTTALSMRRDRIILQDSEVAPVLPEQTPDSIPTPSLSALQFLQSIDDFDFKRIAFGDRLVLCSENRKEIGNFFVSVTPCSNLFGDGFLVKASSTGKMDGMPCGTKITAHISRDMLETIEHHQHDFLILKDESLKRETDIVRQPDGFHISSTTSRGREVKRMNRFVEHAHAGGLISEAADLILQRLLMLKGLPNEFSLISLDMNGNIAAATYEKLEGNDEPGICRTIMSWRDKPLKWHSHFTATGRLTRRQQIGSPISMHLPANSKPETMEDVVNPLHYWKDKVEIRPTFSGYTNGKIKLLIDGQTYIKQHPELSTITTDFLQFLLIHKPANVPVFAANYFFSLGSEMETPEAAAIGSS